MCSSVDRWECKAGTTADSSPQDRRPALRSGTGGCSAGGLVRSDRPGGGRNGVRRGQVLDVGRGGGELPRRGFDVAVRSGESALVLAQVFGPRRVERDLAEPIGLRPVPEKGAARGSGAHP